MWPVHVVRTFCVSISVKKVTTEWRHVSRAVCQQRWRLCSKTNKQTKKINCWEPSNGWGKTEKTMWPAWPACSHRECLKLQCDILQKPGVHVDLSLFPASCHPCCSATWEQQSVKAPLCVALSVHCGGGGRRKELWSSCWWLWKQGALRWLSLASCPPRNLTVSFGINCSQTVWHEDGPTDWAGGAGAQGQPGLGHACKCAFKVRNRKFLFPLLNLCEYLGWNSCVGRGLENRSFQFPLSFAHWILQRFHISFTSVLPQFVVIDRSVSNPSAGAGRPPSPRSTEPFPWHEERGGGRPAGEDFSQQEQKEESGISYSFVGLFWWVYFCF